MLKANNVFCAQIPSKAYGPAPNVGCPELPQWAKRTTALAAFRSLLVQAGLDHAHLELPYWNPLRDIVEDKKVVLKPNWVMHQNASGYDLGCLITHTSILAAILQYVAKARPRSIVVGDAPLQGCDFESLQVNSGTIEMIERFSKNGIGVQVKDFRRTIRRDSRLQTMAQEHCLPFDNFILYDLGGASSLEEISTPSSEFRVTMYDPKLLKRTHGPGKHQYLIARDIIEADVVINVPKLKTHNKACITGALKNLVGINGHKEYLPHHRKGSPDDGGDCYCDRSPVKALLEDLLDAANQANGEVSRWLLANAVRGGMAFAKILNLDDNYEGSWHGNDTVWRMTLDLQRILHYGKQDGTLADSPQRTVLTVTDAIIAGEGDGPLAPTPIGLGMMTMGTSTAAVEWVNALLMGLRPDRIPLTREAFAYNRYLLADFSPRDIAVSVDGQPISVDELFPRYGRAFRLPKGWSETV